MERCRIDGALRQHADRGGIYARQFIDTNSPRPPGDGRDGGASDLDFRTVCRGDGKMQGKRFMICATWNAPREVFDNPNGVLYAGKGTADLFLHITSNYKFTGYDIPRIMGSSIFSRTPTFRARLKTTSGIWRNTACDLKLCLMANIA